jgi:hypothetical protein
MFFLLQLTRDLSEAVLGSTPLQRWEALKNYNHSPAPNSWTTIFGLSMIVLLIVLFFVYRLYRLHQEKGSSSQLFTESARHKGLTDSEYQLLWEIACREGLKRNESIFSLPSAFDRGAAQLVDDAMMEWGIEKGQQVQAELVCLREKLGFRTASLTEFPSALDPGSVSTRQIPVKKKIHIILPNATETCEATVIENKPDELCVSVEDPIEVVFGQVWRCHYYCGGLVWEFETTVTRCSSMQIALNHCDHIAFINRRRILRVPLRRPAFVASFPFTKVLAGREPVRRKKNADCPLDPTPDPVFEPPVFFPAMVTELGGTGLRIETQLKASVGNRVLLVFKLNESATDFSLESGPRTALDVIVEDIAIVRHLSAVDTGYSIALELTRVSEEGVDMLIRATNETAIKRLRMESETGAGQQRIPESIGI